ncbi:MAG: hypothetical protein ACM3YF_02000 [Candidatus Zixiibacteriota bacterium]
MQRYERFFILVVAIVLFVECGKNKGVGIQKELPYGQYVELQPADLPPPPVGMIYQAWVFWLEKSGDSYTAKFNSFQSFGWNGYAYKFTDPVTGADVGFRFKASPDGRNLFTENTTAYMRPDSLAKLMEQLLHGQSVILSGAARNLSGMVGFLLSVEPLGETGVDTTIPKSPFLVGISNDSGTVMMAYPIDYRGPDLKPTYFLASPSDSLIPLCPCEFNDSLILQNEARGVWLGQFDTNKTELGRGAGRPDPVLTGLSRALLPGWKFVAWLQRENGKPVHVGCFFRADSADLCNSYVFNPNFVFPFPGEDFFTNPPPGALDGDRGLLGAKLIVTLEPDRPEDSVMFPMVVFQDTIPQTFTSNPDIDGNRHRNVQYNFVMQNRARFFPKMGLRILSELKK